MPPQDTNTAFVKRQCRTSNDAIQEFPLGSLCAVDVEIYSNQTFIDSMAVAKVTACHSDKRMCTVQVLTDAEAFLLQRPASVPVGCWPPYWLTHNKAPERLPITADALKQLRTDTYTWSEMSNFKHATVLAEIRYGDGPWS